MTSLCCKPLDNFIKLKIKLQKQEKPAAFPRSISTRWGLIACIFMLMVACSKNEKNNKEETIKPEVPVVEKSSGVKVDIASLWTTGDEYLKASVVAADTLNKMIIDLLANPDNKKLLEAQNQWTKLTETYEPFFAFSQLKKNNSAQFAQLSKLNDSIAAWPIQPGYLDSYGRYAFSGLVFNLDIPITETALRDANMMTDAQDVTLGFYALEYILFGEKRLRGPMAFRPITGLGEQHKENGFKHIDELPRNRRRELLRLQSQLLAKDMQTLASIWSNKTQQSLKANFSGLNSKQQTQIVLKAIADTFLKQSLSAEEIGAPALLTKEDAAAKDIERQQRGKRLILQLIGINKLASAVTLEKETQQELLTAINEAAEQIQIAATGQSNGKTAQLPPKLQWQVVSKKLKMLADKLAVLAEK